MMTIVPKASVSPSSTAAKPKHGYYRVYSIVIASIIRHYDWGRYYVRRRHGRRILWIRGDIAYATVHENQTNDDSDQTKVNSVHSAPQTKMLTQLIEIIPVFSTIVEVLGECPVEGGKRCDRHFKNVPGVQQ